MTEAPRKPRRWLASLVAGIVCGGIAFTLSVAGAATSAAPANADVSSAVTLKASVQDPDLASAPMPDLAVTVSQTKNLTAQGIRLSWTGGKKSIAPSAGGNGGENFLQIFMCWGDDPENSARPDRTTCQYGGTGAVGATRDAYRNMPLAEIPQADQQFSAPSAVSFLPPYTAIPFVARDGSRVDGIKTDPATGQKSIDTSVDVNNNQFFTAYTTSEVPWVGSGNDGTGQAGFEVQTVVQSTAMGCGAPVTNGGVTTGAGCWLVVLPRGASDNGSTNITQSGLFIDSWKHALAVKLDFLPAGSACASGQNEKQLQGSELASLAVSSWQPAVCTQAGGSVFSLITSAESDALQTAVTTTDAPLALASYPLNVDQGQNDPLQYAPIALSGITVSLAIDRFPNPNDKNVPQQYLDAARTPFTSVNLTPRLLAKLLSYSYRSSLPTGADTSYLVGKNPYNITQDPDFLAVNDKEWASQVLTGPAIADIIVPQGRSDAARAVWAYIAADKDARDFLASTPDPWDMIVNPYYSTDAKINPTGTAYDIARDNFSKADPIEYTPAGQGPINLITWRPYASDLGSVAYLTLRGDGQGPGTWDPYSIPPKYGKVARMLPGTQRLLGLTSAPAADRYQVVTASLRNTGGQFVGASSASMLAATAVMTPNGAGGRVSGLDYASAAVASAKDAYPLTLPVYAAIDPTKTSASLRSAYASFVRYAAGSVGQAPGTTVGSLPAGYAPLPEAWAKQAITVAKAIEDGKAPEVPTSTPAPSDPPAVTPQQQENVYNTATDGGVPAAPAAPAPAVPAAATGPVAASGASAAPLSAAKTPDDPAMGAIASAIPASAAGALVGAFAFPFLGRLRRRA